MLLRIGTFLASSSTTSPNFRRPAKISSWPRSDFPFGARQAGNSSHHFADRLFMVPQSRQDRYYIIADFRAFQQAVAIQSANVDGAVPEPDIGTAPFAIHAERCFA